MLEPPTKGDERRPGVVNVPIQVTISPVGAVLQEDIVVTITVVGGTATSKRMHVQLKYIQLYQGSQSHHVSATPLTVTYLFI